MRNGFTRAQLLFLTLFFFSNSAPYLFAWTLGSGTLVEDFSDLTHWDVSNSTGLWNIVDQAAQGGRVTGAVASQRISFGDGTDGSLNSSEGYTFDTDSHPNGYNFTYVNITDGIITVKGSKPLIIRSLSTVNILPTISVRGETGASGNANGSTSSPLGGSAIAGLCSGGNGGSAFAPPTGNGFDGKLFDESLDSGNAGAAASGATPGLDASSSAVAQGPRSLWETPGNFHCGSGGAGGGGHVNGVYATGGAGGAGGGTIRIISVGNIQYGTLDARGADAGVGANDGQCSGGGAGGGGGAIWLQTLKSISGTSLLVTGGQNALCNTLSGTALSGTARQDSESTSTPAGFSTGNVAPLQTYTIQSKVYDLGLRNAAFLTSPTVNSVLNGGTVSVSYSGSNDGITFGTYTSDITSLSNQNIRYLKFLISMTTSGSGGATPQVKSISIPFAELNIRLSGGCGIPL